MIEELLKIAEKYNNQKLLLLLKIASKVDELKKQLPDRAAEIEILSQSDPSPTKKYLEWDIKQLINGIDIIKIQNIIQDFHKLYQRLENKDINQYTFEELEKALELLRATPSKRQHKQQIKTEGTEKIYESNRFVVLFPKTKDAVCAYGKGTKWCITEQDAKHYEDYTARGIVFYYIIDKTAPTTDPMHKIALSYLFSSNTYEMNDAEDKRVMDDELSFYLGDEYGSIKNAIDTHAKTEGMQHVNDKMKEIAENGTYQEKVNMAYNAKELPLDVTLVLLEGAIKNNDNDIKEILAGHSQYKEVFKKLLNDKNPVVRAMIAANNAAPEEYILSLLNDEEMIVRNNAITNENTPSQAIKDKLIKKIKVSGAALIRLSQYKDSGVLDSIYYYISGINNKFIEREEIEQILENLSRSIFASSSLLDKLSYNQDDNIRINVAILKKTSPETLTRLSKDDNVLIRKSVAQNSNTPLEVLLHMKENDKDFQVRNIAVYTINYKKLKACIFINLVKLANNLDIKLQIKTANEIDKIIKKKMPVNQVGNQYFPLGQKGDEYGGDADQENEETDELNEDMETRPMEYVSPGQDNLVIDKYDNPGDKWGKDL